MDLFEAGDYSYLPVPIPQIWCESSRSALHPKTILRQIIQTHGPKYELNEHFKIGKLLGSGTFGKVYKVRDLKTRKKHAMKLAEKINIDSTYEQRLRVSEREISLLRVCSHKNIVELIDVIETPTMVYMILELCNQTLETILDKLGKLDEEQVRNVTRQINDALVYLHASEIAHRDLKPSNILCKADHDLGDSFFWEIKLSDFGLAACRGQPGTSKLFTCSCGTPTYMAPEVLNKDPYDQKCDMFSLGVIIFICLIGEEPFPGRTAREVIERHMWSKVTLVGPEWSVFSAAARFIVKKLLMYDPLSRFSSAQLFSHPWTRGNNYIPESTLQPKPRRRHNVPNSSCSDVSALKTCIDSMTKQEPIESKPLDSVIKKKS